MLPLPLPTRDNGADLALTISSTSAGPEKDLLAASEQVILACYQSYLAAMNGLGSCSPTPLDEATATALRKSYLAMGKRVDLKPIRQELLASQLSGDLCPNCGIGEAETLDHYASRDMFPEFSVFAPNLVPCCWICNHEKSSDGGPTVEAIDFIHPYFHVLTDQPIVAATINELGGSIWAKFELVDPVPGNATLAEKIENHVVELGLLRRYERASQGELAAMKAAHVHLVRTGGPAALVQQCLLVAQDCRGSFGTHHWRALLYDALASSPLYSATLLHA